MTAYSRTKTVERVRKMKLRPRRFKRALRIKRRPNRG